MYKMYISLVVGPILLCLSTHFLLHQLIPYFVHGCLGEENDMFMGVMLIIANSRYS